MIINSGVKIVYLLTSEMSLNSSKLYGLGLVGGAHQILLTQKSVSPISSSGFWTSTIFEPDVKLFLR